jgi:hypothetical protein
VYAFPVKREGDACNAHGGREKSWDRKKCRLNFYKGCYIHHGRDSAQQHFIAMIKSAFHTGYDAISGEISASYNNDLTALDTLGRFDGR